MVMTLIEFSFRQKRINGYSRQQWGLHGGASDGGQVCGASGNGDVPDMRAAAALISFSTLGRAHCGHTGVSPFRTSASN
jgi:hypothetical protein